MRMGSNKKADEESGWKHNGHRAINFIFPVQSKQYGCAS